MLVAKNISKSFSGVKVLEEVNLTLYPGKVNAIIGENGAGKSTLMKILSGIYSDYEGEIVYNDHVLKMRSAKEATEAGIAIIHQELNLVPYLSISENIFLGREMTNQLGVMDRKSMAIETKSLLSKVDLKVSPGILVSDLKVGEQQLVEIAKALHVDADIIIMDEPTSAITEKEVKNLYKIIDELKERGKTIVYISHKMEELFLKADKFMVLRDGRTIGAGDIKDISRADLIEMMVGRKVLFEKNTDSGINPEVLFEVKDLNLKRTGKEANKAYLIKDISFALHRGEVLGIYGLMGAGRTELLESIFGLHPGKVTGDVIMEGSKKAINNPSEAIHAGIMLVPEDRKLQGLCLNLNVRANISLTVLRQLLTLNTFIDKRKETDLVKKYIRQLNIKTSSDELQASKLSGGNQQKIVIAKWLARQPAVLLLDEPTRGIDIGAKAEIYKLIKELSVSGIGIIVVSSEIPEVLALSHRVLVMNEGKITARMTVEEANESNILTHAISEHE